MYAVLDNLVALLVGSVVMIVIMNTATRVQQYNREEVSNYAAKLYAKELSTWVEDDLSMLGVDMDASEVPFTNPVNEDGVTKSFTFFYNEEDTLTTTNTQVAVRYTLNEVGSRVIYGDSIKVYQMQRSKRVGALGTWEEDGRSPELLSFFLVEMLDADTEPIADPEAAWTNDPTSVRNTRVRFTMLTPYDDDQMALRRLFYGSTVMILD